MRMREPFTSEDTRAMQGSQRRPFLTVSSERLAPDSYVTDGKRLLRVVSHFEADAGSMFASLEDCLTLEVRDP
jgi:hypothetical protein